MKQDLYLCLHAVDYKLSTERTEETPHELSITDERRWSPVTVRNHEYAEPTCYFYERSGLSRKATMVDCVVTCIDDSLKRIEYTKYGFGYNQGKAIVSTRAEAHFQVTCPNGLKTQYYNILICDLMGFAKRRANKEEIIEMVKALVSDFRSTLFSFDYYDEDKQEFIAVKPTESPKDLVIS